MPSTKEQNAVDKLRAGAPKFIELLGGRLLTVDFETQSCTFEFNVSTDFCHSVDIVQGGFTTAMLDAAMSHVVYACDDSVKGLSSLEIKTSYLDVTRAGVLRAEGYIVKAGYKTAFLEGRLYNAEGVLCATASSVAKISRK
ncbi:PaaI family thioesterase [Spongiibacter sp. KMU-166]|uniref:PaaI family thioesterase n=1 Tax=Spongiibacter thalassae TaxID=2721624 RepID=A0ABX1G9T2_9GAMM|nr:PaaI family thioesterase [Spongiibacter thalassae]NKI15921.1 PaaI family thioesterase [Spongiibacter thalassae]